MIIMIISYSPADERKRLVAAAKTQAAFHTDDHWRYIESGTVNGLINSIKELDKADIICLDLTMDGSIKMAEALRESYPDSYMILIADNRISPVSYIRPSIQAESLMLKPINEKQLSSIFSEAILYYAKSLEAPDETRYFIAENKGCRNLIAYDRILFFESREKKVFLSTEREEFGFYDTLDELENKLDESFIRCHRSFIVNTRRITGVEISAGKIELDDGTYLPLSRSYKQAVKNYLKEKQSSEFNCRK